MTLAIIFVDDAIRAEIFELIRNYETFIDSNDPYGEHDFGIIDHQSAGRILWKIDYFSDDKCEGYSTRPDTVRCHRKLTIMLAEEY